MPNNSLLKKKNVSKLLNRDADAQCYLISFVINFFPSSLSSIAPPPL